MKQIFAQIMTGFLLGLIVALGAWYFWPKEEPAKPVSQPKVIQVPVPADTNQIKKELTEEIYKQARKEAEAEFKRRIIVLPENSSGALMAAVRPDNAKPINMTRKAEPFHTSKLVYQEPAFKMNVYLWSERPVLNSAMTYELDIDYQRITERRIVFGAWSVGVAALIYNGIRSW